MPKQSQTDNVKKRCDCVKWKTCSHPWYLDYQKDNIRFRDNLDKLIDRHCADFAEAVDEARRAILAKLEGRNPKGLVPTDDPTLAKLLEAYEGERPRRDRWQRGRINATVLPTLSGRRPFGEWRLSAITTDTLRQFRQLRPLVAGNRDLNFLRAAFNWAVLHGLIARSPFRIGDVPAIRLGREEARTRRLYPGEGERLVANAGGALRGIIIAAIETGMRRGEILSLQWNQISFSPKAEIFLPATKTKTKHDRRVPITSALAEVLRARQCDPNGDALPSNAFVFGDEIGRERKSIKTAWRLTLQRAKIDGLHFHDLRREAGSRWMDHGVDLGSIQRWLGHANISQTSTYLGASLGSDEQIMRAYEERIGRRKPVTQSDVFDRPTSNSTDPNPWDAFENIQQSDKVH